MSVNNNEIFMSRAIELAQKGMSTNNGGPFGAVIVKEDQIIGEGYNSVTSKNDPTAHAEIVAIKNACQVLKTYHLSGCEIYCSSEPCPMCLGAIYWARIDKIYFATNRLQASNIDFDDDFIYKEISLDIDKRKIPAEQLLENEGLALLEAWIKKPDKTLY